MATKLIKDLDMKELAAYLDQYRYAVTDQGREIHEKLKNELKKRLLIKKETDAHSEKT